MQTPVRYVLISLGLLSVGLALAGIFLPLLPTTPFLLLAAFFFARSSDRFYEWLHTNRWFGEYLRNYREGRGIPVREKVITISLLWIVIGLSAALAVSNWWIRGVLVAIAITVTVHLMRTKTYRSGSDPPSPNLLDPELN